MGKVAPPIAFLGVCDRASRTQLWQDFTQLSVIGLRDLILVPVLPMNLDGAQLIFSLFTPAMIGNEFLVRLRDPRGRDVGEVRFRAISQNAEHTSSSSVEKSVAGELHAGGWMTSIVPPGFGPSWLLTLAGAYTFYLEQPNGVSVPVGVFNVGILRVEPLSEARIAAIRSDPHAAKVVRATIACGKCKSEISPYAGLERSRKFEEDGCTWYSDLGDTFICACGELNLSLETMRSNMHGMLGRHEGIATTSVVPLYETLTLQGIRNDFLALVEKDPEEELLQQFLASNLVALHTIAPAAKIFLKAPISTKYKTDFAILTPSRELVLIEIERAGTRLMKSDGGVAAPLQHALDQVNNWLYALQEHRAAVLDGIGVASNEVSRVRGVVVAGRDRGYDYSHLRKLKGREFGVITLLTYDDVVGALQALASEVRKI